MDMIECERNDPPSPPDKNHLNQAIPANESSDPDLYVSNRHHKVANKVFYHWKSALVGRDRVDVHPSHRDAVPGRYTIGVLGYSDITSFILTSVRREPPPVVELEPGAPWVHDGSGAAREHHFAYRVCPEKASTIFFKCSPSSELDR